MDSNGFDIPPFDALARALGSVTDATTSEQRLTEAYPHADAGRFRETSATSSALSNVMMSRRVINLRHSDGRPAITDVLGPTGQSVGRLPGRGQRILGQAPNQVEIDAVGGTITIPDTEQAGTSVPAGGTIGVWGHVDGERRHLGVVQVRPGSTLTWEDDPDTSAAPPAPPATGAADEGNASGSDSGGGGTSASMALHPQSGSVLGGYGTQLPIPGTPASALNGVMLSEAAGTQWIFGTGPGMVTVHGEGDQVVVDHAGPQAEWSHDLRHPGGIIINVGPEAVEVTSENGHITSPAESRGLGTSMMASTFPPGLLIWGTPQGNVQLFPVGDSTVRILDKDPGTTTEPDGEGGFWVGEGVDRHHIVNIGGELTSPEPSIPEQAAQSVTLNPAGRELTANIPGFTPAPDFRPAPGFTPAPSISNVLHSEGVKGEPITLGSGNSEVTLQGIGDRVHVDKLGPDVSVLPWGSGGAVVFFPGGPRTVTSSGGRLNVSEGAPAGAESRMLSVPADVIDDELAPDEKPWNVGHADGLVLDNLGVHDPGTGVAGIPLPDPSPELRDPNAFYSVGEEDPIGANPYDWGQADGRVLDVLGVHDPSAGVAGIPLPDPDAGVVDDLDTIYSVAADGTETAATGPGIGPVETWGPADNPVRLQGRGGRVHIVAPLPDIKGKSEPPIRIPPGEDGGVVVQDENGKWHDVRSIDGRLVGERTDPPTLPERSRKLEPFVKRNALPTNPATLNALADISDAAARSTVAEPMGPLPPPATTAQRAEATQGSSNTTKMAERGALMTGALILGTILYRAATGVAGLIINVNPEGQPPEA